MLVGYARVSTRSQGDSLDTQEAMLREHGCDRVFSDTISGAKSSRPGLDAALDFMRDGDVLVVTRLDRLGRTALDTLRTIDDLASRGVPVVLLKPELDTRTKEGKLMVSIMAGLAEFERDLLIERTNEGLRSARARGRKGGRPVTISDGRKAKFLAAVRSGDSVREAAKACGVSESYGYELVRRAREQETPTEELNHE